MFVQRISSFKEHARQKGMCSLCGRNAPWVETFQSEDERGFSLDDPCLMFALHRKLYIGQVFDKDQLDGLLYSLMKFRNDNELNQEPVEIYWEVKGGFLSAPYMLLGFFSFYDQLLEGADPLMPISVTYVGDSSGGGAFAALAFDKEKRRILKDARVNFFCEKKPENHAEDEIFNRHVKQGIEHADMYARESKWTTEEMKEIMKKIHSSYKYIYAIKGEPKTFFEGFINLLSKDLGSSKEDVEQLMKEDRWYGAEELCEMGFFHEVVDSDETVKKDLGFVRPYST